MYLVFKIVNSKKHGLSCETEELSHQSESILDSWDETTRLPPREAKRSASEASRYCFRRVQRAMISFWLGFLGLAFVLFWLGFFFWLGFVFFFWLGFFGLAFSFLAWFSGLGLAGLAFFCFALFFVGFRLGCFLLCLAFFFLSFLVFGLVSV